MREIKDWDEDYILTSLPIGEFDWFEAKGSKVIKPDTKEIDRELLSKAISAFANTGGGVLVIGIKQSGKGWQVDDGGVLTQVGRTSTKEWLEDIIPHLVELPLLSFNVYEVKSTVKDLLVSRDRAIFIIEIENSEAAPHQAIDKIYYGRVGGKSKPLPHRFILDILGRRKNPNIQIEFKIIKKIENAKKVKKEKKIKIDDLLTFGDKLFLNVVARNVGSVYAQYVNCYIYLPMTLVYELPSVPDAVVKRDDGNEYWVIRFSNVAKSTDDRFVPVLPNLSHRWKFELSHLYDHDPITQHDGVIYWEVYADNAPKNFGVMPLSDIKLLA